MEIHTVKQVICLISSCKKFLIILKYKQGYLKELMKILVTEWVFGLLKSVYIGMQV